MYLRLYVAKQVLNTGSIRPIQARQRTCVLSKGTCTMNGDTVLVRLLQAI